NYRTLYHSCLPDDAAHTEIYTLSLHDALPISVASSFHVAERWGIGVGSMVFAPELDYDEWEIYNPDLLIANFNEGNFGEWTGPRSEEHTSELQSRSELVCRLLLEKKNKKQCRG